MVEYHRSFNEDDTISMVANDEWHGGNTGHTENTQHCKQGLVYKVHMFLGKRDAHSLEGGLMVLS